MYIYASMQVCKYASMHVYASMQVCKYASMKVYTCLYKKLNKEIFLITTLTKSKCQNIRYTNKSDALYLSAVAAFLLVV